RLLQLLRAHRERPRCRTAKKCDELAPPHTGPKGVALREFYLVLGLVTRKFGLNNGSDGMSALGHVWTAPWQELSDAAAALVGCGHVSGLIVRRIWPLALMLCADRVPIESTHFKVR